MIEPTDDRAPLGTVVIVGASLAGVRAAQALRREGHEGRIVVVGAEEHWPPFDRPPLSKQVLTGAWPPDQARLRVPDPFDAELVLGRHAGRLDLDDRTVTLDDGSSVAFDALVVATGAVPRTLPGTEGTPGVHVLRTVDDALALRSALVDGDVRRVAVVGAGFIGCEVASSCRTLGLDVSIIEALDLPLTRVLGPQMGAFGAALQRAHGVDLHLGIGVRAVEGDGRVERLILADGTVVEADVVVVGIGVRPATDWLEGSGLTVEDGVVCDAACVAVGSGGRVVAAGDVARWHHPLFGVSMRVEHWTNASDQAAHVAKVLVHGPEAAGPFGPVPYFWSDQHGTKLQFVGSSAPDDEVDVVEGEVEDGKFVAAYGRDGVVVGALCVNWPARMVPWSKQVAERKPFTRRSSR
jgi:NADPH-dependent 2,4-dienoyl-CoA reductase/sulfur reductase-like enzyme